MRTDDFNLIDEPWIKVRTADAQVKELSLEDVFQQAHEIRAIAGELPTQDAAILRLLLAVLHTVFSRVDLDGEPSPLEEKDDALDRWQELWDGKQFPMEPLQTYLDSVKERFWLFDEEYPFYQFPEAKELSKGEVKCKASKLNGSINESNNKARLFMGRHGEEKESLSYAEAARWLVHTVAYDDSTVKPTAAFNQRKANTKDKTESPGCGWMGKLGLVYAEGDNLFETLMLNLVFCPNAQWDEDHQEENPVWEWKDLSIQERKKVICPDNMAELLTFPSRCFLLERNNGRVIGAYPVGGMYFDEAAPLEQMTVRQGYTERKNTSPHKIFEPEKHEEGAFFWQEFVSLLTQSEAEKDCRPGVVQWINYLQSCDADTLDPEKLIRFSSVSMDYGDKGGSFKDARFDSLRLHTGLLSELGESWRKLISDEISFSKRIADKVKFLAQDLYIAENGSVGEDIVDNRKKDAVIRAGKNACIRFYGALDVHFRRWLESISVSSSDEEEKRKEWRELVLKEAASLAVELVNHAGPAAYQGKWIEHKKEKTKKLYSAPKAWANFRRGLNYLKKT